MTKFCKCGCGKETVKGRDYCWGHKGKKGAGQRSITVSVAARDALRSAPGGRSGEFQVRSGSAHDEAGDEIATFTVNLTEPVMDALWGLLDGRKKAALLSKIGA